MTAPSSGGVDCKQQYVYPMDKKLEENLVAMKSEFILSFVRLGEWQERFTLHLKTVIDKAARNIYQEYEKYQMFFLFF